MATVACPGCGLPRAEDEVGAKPCPVCDAPAAMQSPRAKEQPAPDPTAGLPADVSELYTPDTQAPPAHKRLPEARSRLLFATVMFVLGTLCGVGGVLGVQALKGAKPKPDESSEPAVANAIPPASRTPAPASRLSSSDEPRVQAGSSQSPMPHEAVSQFAGTKQDPDFKLPAPPPPPVRATVIEVNQPDDTYVVPFSMKNGEHVILRGKVKTLRVHALDAGAVLDASALEASVITVTGKIDNHSTLKLNAPHGTVHVTGKVDGQSAVMINAPEGEVRFMLMTTNAREGSKIDNGSQVAVTASTVELRGDITGTDTKVSVMLSRNAWLKIATVTDNATVEYKSQTPDGPPPEVIVGTVARTAKVRSLD